MCQSAISLDYKNTNGKKSIPNAYVSKTTTIKMNWKKLHFGVHTRMRRKTNQKSFNNFNWREPIFWQPNGETSAHLWLLRCCPSKTRRARARTKRKKNRNCQSKHLNQTYSKPNKNSIVKKLELEPNRTRKNGKAKKKPSVYIARQYYFDSLKSLKVIPKVPTATYRKGGKSVQCAASPGWMCGECECSSHMK